MTGLGLGGWWNGERWDGITYRDMYNSPSYHADYVASSNMQNM